MIFSNMHKIFLGALLAVGFGLTATPAFADSPRAEYHLQVSPTSQEIKNLKPGEVYHGEFLVQNIGTKNFKYKVYATPFYVENENYSPDYNKSSNYTQIAKWITFSSTSGTLASDTTAVVKYTVKVPKDVPAGGQYAALMTEIVDQDKSTATVQVINRIGMTLYSSVSGKTKVSGSIIDNNIATFFTAPPLSATSLVENTGNIDAKAKYTFKVYSLFNSDEPVFSNVKSEGNTKPVLPETRRFNTVIWEGAPQLGVFNVEQTVEFLGKSSTTRKLVVICPIWLIILIALILVASIAWLVGRSRARK